VPKENTCGAAHDYEICIEIGREKEGDFQTFLGKVVGGKERFTGDREVI